MQKIIPYLWFDNQAEEAVNFYTATFENSKISSVYRYGKAGAEITERAEGSVMSATFELEGLEFIALNGGPQFSFTPAISFCVFCETQEKITEIWGKFFVGGKVLVELNKYPFSEQFGWLIDQFGVSWQFNLLPRVPKIAPFLMFCGEQYGKAQEAMNLYTSIFRNSKIIHIEHNGTNDEEQDGSVKQALFSLEGQEFLSIDGNENYPFSFTPAISFFVNCETQEEVDYLWNQLSREGIIEQCGWLKDQYGLSWQIVPTALGEILENSNSDQSERVMEVLFKMNKIEIAELKKAFAQN